MKKFNLKYSEIIEAMDRRSFLKFLGKAPAAAAAQTSLGNIKQAPSLLNSAIKIVNMFKPIGLGLSGVLPANDVNFTASSFGDMSLATGDLKSQLLKIAFKLIKASRLVPSHVTYTSQSECFISALQNYTTLLMTSAPGRIN